jgi:DNA polymerase-3 subunit gamma/tau
MNRQLTIAYRPKKFSQILGQRSALRVVKGFLEKGRVPGTLLFSGPRGVGKTTLARILARRLNCLEPADVEPCGKCDSCKSENHPDILELNAASDRGIDMVRGLDQISMLAPRYKKRVIVLDEAHALTPSAGQALLKTLEETPDSACFIVVTTNPEKLPETVLSRCSKITLSTVAAPVITKRLVTLAKKEGVNLAAKDALRITEASDGHPREALMLLEQVLSSEGSQEELSAIIAEVIRRVPQSAFYEFSKPFLAQEAKQALEAVAKIEETEIAFLFTRILELLDEMLVALVMEKPHSHPKFNKLMPQGEDAIETLFQGLELFADWHYNAQLGKCSWRQALNHAVIGYCLG